MCLIGEDPNGIPNNLFSYVARVAVRKLLELTVFGWNYPKHDSAGVRDHMPNWPICPPVDVPPVLSSGWVQSLTPAWRLDVKKRFTEEQIIGFLREAERGVGVKELYRKHGFSEASYYLWRSKFGGMDVSDARRLKALEAENARLKKLLAETMLENEVTKEALRKNGDRASEA